MISAGSLTFLATPSIQSVLPLSDLPETVANLGSHNSRVEQPGAAAATAAASLTMHQRYRLERTVDGSFRISVEEWDRVKERERLLDEDNRRLSADNDILRADLTAAQGEVHRLSTCVVPELEKKNETLSADNQGLRQTVDKAADQAAKYQADLDDAGQRADRLERENNDLGAANAELRERVRELERDHHHDDRHRHHVPLVRDLRYWRDEAHFWRAKFDALVKKHNDIIEVLALRTRRMESYEDMLKMRGII
ncbi:hypothetical protein GMORB2_6388 [Geosmithia morbida]|uniref:Uncharacterized protein n=1 Tax=Geosmithia morbida TaxID=1094350 RepID=A0A9P4YW92_9HYPO|nr:uncharacterized protein GMORB2_6388 [Geosmithia morbida]KAF4123687.1 hypothetical protein GMORB2_6388 [Geosmithia morbida]